MAAPVAKKKSDYRMYLFFAAWHEHSNNLVPVFKELEKTNPGKPKVLLLP